MCARENQPATEEPVIIAGLPRLEWGKHRDCTFAGALEAATAVTPYPAAYDFLMGATGMAFRTRWFRGEPPRAWCPSSPVGEFPEEIRAAALASGWRLESVARLEQTPPDMTDCGPRIEAALRAGQPVLCYDAMLNMAVIHGIASDHRTLTLSTYDSPDITLELSQLPGLLLFLNEHCAPLTPEEAVRAAMATAVRNWSRPADPAGAKGGRYLFGRAAFEQWRHDLLAMADYAEEQRKQLFFVSWWTMCSLIDAREAAARFLRQSAALLPEGGRLEAAASHYEREAADLTAAAYERREGFWGPWTGFTASDWTVSVAEREAELLSRAAAREADALTELESRV